MTRVYANMLVLFFIVHSLNAQVIDTLKYYYPYDPDLQNILAFVEICGTPGYCEPVAVWFTPDSSVSDSSYKYYSIKTIRFCFAGNIYEDTTFTIHLSDSIPDYSNQIYKRYISVDESDRNPNFVSDGIYKFKDFDVSSAIQLSNIDIKIPFWVVLQNKVWAIYNTHPEDWMYYESRHSFQNGLPRIEWLRVPGDWIVEAVVEYHEVLSLENPSDNKLIPEKAKLFQNYPNPFNSSESTIRYKLYNSGFVELEIYSTLGKKLKTLVNQNQKGGDYNVKFNMENLSSGIYYYVLNIDGKWISSKKMTFIK